MTTTFPISRSQLLTKLRARGWIMAPEGAVSEGSLRAYLVSDAAGQTLTRILIEEVGTRQCRVFEQRNADDGDDPANALHDAFNALLDRAELRRLDSKGTTT